MTVFIASKIKRALFIKKEFNLFVVFDLCTLTYFNKITRQCSSESREIIYRKPFV